MPRVYQKVPKKYNHPLCPVILTRRCNLKKFLIEVKQKKSRPNPTPEARNILEGF